MYGAYYTANSSVNVPVIIPVNTCTSNLNRAIIVLDILLCSESSCSWNKSWSEKSNHLFLMAILQAYTLVDKKCIKFTWVNIPTDQMDN